MALANCKDCGRLFNMTHRDICPACVREEDNKFIIVRNYLKENRGASINEVSEATEVDANLIIKFIREGRLATEANPNLNFPCESCGELITVGRFCRSCKDRLKKDFGQTKDELLHSANNKNDRVDYYSKRNR